MSSPLSVAVSHGSESVLGHLSVKRVQVDSLVSLTLEGDAGASASHVGGSDL